MPRSHHKSGIKRFDTRDRLILALAAQLKAERETREAMEWVIRNGGLSKEVLEAMASDPIPVVTEDLQMVEHALKKLQRDERHEHGPP
jgi:hypothetical protein